MQKIFREIKKSTSFKSQSTLDFPAHIHDEIELAFVKNGSAVAYCDGKEYVLTNNTFFLTFPNQVHRYVNSKKGEYKVFLIKPLDLFGYARIFEEYVACCATWECNNKNILTLLELIEKEYAANKGDAVTRSLITALIGKLLQSYELEKSKVFYDSVSRVLKYCTEHYKESITLESVAKNTHLCTSSVSHIFSERLKMSFCDYINSLRLGDAVYMLKNKNYSITQIASLSGFSTIRTFNRAFLKHYGLTPSEYRKLTI